MTKMPGLRLAAVWLLCLAALAVESPHAPAAEPALRNVVFNGDFLYETRGWNFYNDKKKNKNARFSIIKHQVVDLEEKAARVEWVGKKGVGWPRLIGRYPIAVSQGKVYFIQFKARGKGSISTGVCEYTPKFLRSKTNVHKLAENVQTFSYEYSPSAPEAKEIRTSIFFNPSPSESDPSWCEIFEVVLMLPAAEFEKAMRWPEGWEKFATSEQIHAHFKNKFKDYHGLSAEEQKALSEAVEVKDVLPPYRPIEKTGAGEFALTNSTWRFGNSALPSSLEILEKPVLAEAFSLRVSTGGRTQIWKAGADGTCTPGESEVVITREGRCGDLKARLEGKLLYDGVFVVTVELDAPTPIKIEKAEIRICFPASVAKYIRFDTLSGGSGHGWLFGFGPIPAPGEKVDTKYSVMGGGSRNEWKPNIYAGKQAAIWQWAHEDEPFLKYFWIGDEEKGLAWFAESDQGWHYCPGDATFLLERQGETVVARVVFITQPLELRGKRKVRFGFQAMPPKPVHTDWHRLRFVWLGFNEKKNRHFKLGNIPEETYKPGTYVSCAWYSAWSAGCSSPLVKTPDALKKLMQGARATRSVMLPYLALTHISVNSPEGYYHGVTTREWAKIPYHVYFPEKLEDADAAIVKTCTNSFFAESMAAGIGKLIDEYDIDGIYFDNCTFRTCSNTAHGCGYRDDNGLLKPTIPFMAVRRFFMMVQNEFYKRGKKGLLWCHGSEYPAQISFVDFGLLGEGVYGMDHTEDISPGEMRANFIGPNQFGFVRVFLPQFGHGLAPEAAKKAYTTPGPTRTMMALMLLHGAKTWRVSCCGEPIIKASALFDQLGEAPVEFLPYWKWDIDDSMNKKSVYASLYKGKDASLLFVSNLSAEERHVEFSLADLRKTAGAFKEITDPMDKLPVDSTATVLKLDITRKNFRILLLSGHHLPGTGDIRINDIR